MSGLAVYFNMFFFYRVQALNHPRRLALLAACCLVVALLLPGAGAAQAAVLNHFRLVHQDNLLLHLDFQQQPSSISVFQLADPRRLVIDLGQTQLAPGVKAGKWENGAVAAVRYGQQKDGKLRLVLEMREMPQPSHQFVRRNDGTRLIVDLGVAGIPMLADASSQVFEQAKVPLHDLIVAIDAGHGGKDPGAIGGGQTREKDVTLRIARKLFARLLDVPGIQPVLIRQDDRFIALRARIQRARELEADLFVSIHADAIPRKTAAGSSVYVLSLKGASSETAQWLADNENQADLFGDVALEGMSRDLQQTLIELAQNRTLESSMSLGQALLFELGEIGPLHKKTVEMANFAVLKSPDIPSVLVETAFISNPAEERKLNSRRYQDQLAAALHKGIIRFFESQSPKGTRFAEAGG